MALLILPLAIVGGIGSLVCWIIVLIKMFTDEGALKGILGLICGLYAFIWGWQHKAETGIVMPIWTVCILLGVVVRVVGAANVH